MLKLIEEKASIHPLKSKLKISILSDEEISRINQTSLDILEDIGFVMPSVKAWISINSLSSFPSSWLSIL